jgi:hypothetical protein
VNILVGLDAASVKVAHSYFLVADSDGNILASTPKITRQARLQRKTVIRKHVIHTLGQPGHLREVHWLPPGSF